MHDHKDVRLIARGQRRIGFDGDCLELRKLGDGQLTGVEFGLIASIIPSWRA